MLPEHEHTAILERICRALTTAPDTLPFNIYSIPSEGMPRILRRVHFLEFDTFHPHAYIISFATEPYKAFCMCHLASDLVHQSYDGDQLSHHLRAKMNAINPAELKLVHEYTTQASPLTVTPDVVIVFGTHMKESQLYETGFIFERAWYRPTEGIKEFQKQASKLIGHFDCRVISR